MANKIKIKHFIFSFSDKKIIAKVVFDFFMKVKSQNKLMMVVPNLNYGGTQRVVVTLNRHLKYHYNIVLVLLTNQKDFDYDGRVIAMPFGIRNDFLGKALTFTRRALYLRKICKKESPDVVLSFTESSNFVTLLACRGSAVTILGVRNFLSVMEQGNKAIQYMFRKAIRFSYRFADKVFANSKESAQDLVANFKLEPDKVAFIYNPIDIKYVETKSLEEVRHQDRSIFERGVPIIVTIGRMVKQKGHSDLIKAFALVRKKVDAHLLVIGEGGLKQDLASLTRKYSLQDSITFTGFIDNVYPYLSKSTVFVLPSYHEGFPNVLLEAMAVGLPIISYDCNSGPKEMLCDGKYGELSPVGNYRLLASKIISLLENDDRREGLASSALKRVKDFDAQSISVEYRNLIDSSCRDKGVFP